MVTCNDFKPRKIVSTFIVYYRTRARRIVGLVHSAALLPASCMHPSPSPGPTHRVVRHHGRTGGARRALVRQSAAIGARVGFYVEANKPGGRPDGPTVSHGLTTQLRTSIPVLSAGDSVGFERQVSRPKSAVPAVGFGAWR